MQERTMEEINEQLKASVSNTERDNQFEEVEDRGSVEEE
ncbi:hypothetical protein Pint_19056 [Pistacia integerrima]|uniref:Uncharacterized protein n=1 Tax=Pistacia integerrima TaxID=434235 RepID=A0ACC0YSX6_9ROSI|nr:hypothetical protein Pint_19056 [Pistacia integerrima]